MIVGVDEAGRGPLAGPVVAAARDYPGFGWETNMGYGTAYHLAALRQHGPTPLHRTSFAPVAQMQLV